MLIPGSTLVPVRLRRLEVGVSVPDGLSRPEERRLVPQAAGGRKVGAGSLGPLARRGRWQALGAVASARDRLDFAHVCFTGSNLIFFLLIYHQRN